jgi:hypothetical protein
MWEQWDGEHLVLYPSSFNSFLRVSVPRGEKEQAQTKSPLSFYASAGFETCVAV